VDARLGEFTISCDPERLDLDVVHGFLAGESYWSRGIARDRLERAIRNSLCFGLYDRDSQVGFARVITDRATFAYLCDVFVLESHRGRGLGQWLLETMRTHPDLAGLRRWALLTRDAHPFYERLGWNRPALPEMYMEMVAPSAAPPDSRSRESGKA
jgi:N-acetylglutamate synthase-like GNAT family acetyltransferase